MTTQEEHETEGSAVLNGYSVALRPFAYYLGLDYDDLRPGETQLGANSKTVTLGLGFKPTYAASLFGFGNTTQIDAKLTDIPLGFIGNEATITDRRVDGGGSYRFSPTSQLWVKAGHGSEDVDLRGVFYSPSIAKLYSDLAFADIDPMGKVDHYASRASQDDVQLRQIVDLGPHRLSVGWEHGKQDKRLDSTVEFAPIRDRLAQTTRYQSDTAFLSDQYHVDGLLLQGDLAYSHFQKRYELDRFQQFGHFDEQLVGVAHDDRDQHDVDPRLGIAWSPAQGSMLRVVYQSWQRPVSVATLDQVDTAGIPVDDRLTAIGGRLKRGRLQFEWQLGQDTFWQVYADHRKVENPSNPATDSVADINLQDLDRLRNRNRLSLTTVDLLEQDPVFSAGRVNAAGVAVNQIVRANWSVAARYQYQQTRNTGDFYSGKELPWLPRNLFMVESSWLPLPRLLLGADITYRSERYTDEANLNRLKAGWGAGLHGYWESSDKRWSVEGVAENLYANKDAAAVRPARLGMQVLYRF